MISQDTLKELMDYNPETGIFTRLKTVNSRAIKGMLVGSNCSAGYLRVGIKGREHLMHRLAFLYMDNDIPEEVDHINHKRNDNRWCNLRRATRKTNQQNKRMTRKNTSGASGVWWCRPRNRWQAEIKYNGKKIYLGQYKEKIDAIIAKKMAEYEHGFHANHGSK